MKHCNSLLIILVLFIFQHTSSSAFTNNNRHSIDSINKAIDTLEKEKIVLFNLSYLGDVSGNLSGGIQTGFAYMGMANLMIETDLEKARLIKGGKIFLNAANIHATRSLTELTGDIQVSSNIDAGNHTYLQELWYKQVLGNLELTFGLQDLNVEFACSDHGGSYINSSFGILPTISLNTSAPIFPLTTLGFTAKWNITDKLTWLGTIHDGSATDFEDNPYNLKWHLKKTDHLLTVTEIQFHNNLENLPGSYKVGAFMTNHLRKQSPEDVLADTFNVATHGFYFHADQNFWSSGNKSAGLFSQVGYTPVETSVSDYYISLGLNYNGLFTKSGNDILGIAVGYTHFTHFEDTHQSPRLKPETVIELTYQYQVNDFFFIQPDLQYIINPAGTGANLESAFVGILRLGVSL